MYESELNSRRETLQQIPEAIQELFTQANTQVTARTVLPWSEHCTECAAPACFTTCELYSRRPRDGKCRRFVDGMVRIDLPGAIQPYLLKIRFKRWGKLWSPGNLRLHSVPQARRLDHWDLWIGALWRCLPLACLPLPRSWKTRLISKRYFAKKRSAATPQTQGGIPSHFLIECYNPDAQAIPLTLTIRSAVAGEQHRVYQHLIDVPQGYLCTRIPIQEIAARLDLRREFEVEVVPNEIQDDTTLYFGLLEFIRAPVATTTQRPSGDLSRQPSVKCVVWDLDDTLWDGVLAEDGFEGLRLKAGIKEILTALDQRGILCSIASKNHHQPAMAALQQWGLDHFFLHPQISWNPKSLAIGEIAGRLNIATDTFLFLDDQPFERAEVATVWSDVRAVDAQDYAQLLERPDCQGSSAPDASRRRQMYREQSQRESVQREYGEEQYFQFLRDCRIVLEVQGLQERDLQRVHDLVQRTNQMNFSGSRYTRQDLAAMLVAPMVETYVLKCRDRFGSYGTVGFAVVDPQEPRMLDLMLSCRIQHKRVEHAFLAYLIGSYRQAGTQDFFVNYRKTERNAPQGKVFADLGFQEQSLTGNLTSLVFEASRAVPVVDTLQLVATSLEARQS